ncbi:MAG: aldehyde dehydrogenase family protein [Hymenobacter sp.]|nr:MAG: aldehyde dehydrogenase family protein [Hymenobacter sp.]
MEVQALQYPAIRNYVAGQLTTDKPGVILEVFSPLTGEVISTVPLSNAAALDATVQAAKAAFPAWAAVPIKEKAYIFYRCKTLFAHHMHALAGLVREENGKTYNEARA